jgi:signal transduction histidine kinase
VIISIVDDGPGISPDQRASVFEIGTRLDETKAGRGLGLAISRDLAALYGGTVELDDAPGGGLRATLKLEFSEGE